jgi:hypothetical protein
MRVRAIGSCLVLLIGALVQPAKPQTPSPAANQQSAETGSASNLTLAEQRALSVVDHLLEVSRTFPDDYLAIKFQAQVADTLWAYDAARSRKLLADAFRAIDYVSEPADKGVRPIYLGADTSWPLRRDVLRIAARGDSALAQQLAESVIPDPAVSIANPPDRMTGMPNEKEDLYLGVAGQILPSDQSRATELARTALSHSNGNNEILAGFIRLVQSLQARDPNAADDLFAYAIAETQRHPDHAFGSIRFLGLYCFPDSGGTVRFRTIPPTPAPGNSVQAGPVAINRFLSFAYDTVMRQPETEPPRPNWSAGGGLPRWVGNDYYAIRLLAPYFDKYFPEKAQSFRAKLEALIKGLPPAAADPRPLAPPDPNNIDAQIAAAEKTRFEGERDSLYNRAVELALMANEYDRALTLANKIGDSSQRSAAIMRVMSAAVSLSIQKKDFDGAYNYSKQMPDSERLGVLRSLALAVAPNEKARAEELLAEAFQLAESLEDNSLKASQLMSTASIASRVDIESGFRAMRLAVDQINRTGYNVMEEDAARPGASGHSTTMHRLGYQGIMMTFDTVFKPLGLADFTHAMQLAQSIEARELSAMAQLSVCRAVLSRLFVTHVARQIAAEDVFSGYSLF